MSKKEVKKELITLSERNKEILKDLDLKIKELNTQFGIISGHKQSILTAIVNEKSTSNVKFKLNDNYDLEEFDDSEKEAPDKK